MTAIKQLVDTGGLLNERRSGRSDRSADFAALARWFAEAPDEAAAHQLWRAAFGLSPARHLSVTGDTALTQSGGRSYLDSPANEAGAHKHPLTAPFRTAGSCGT